MYRNFYLEAKRKLKLNLPDYLGCTSVLNALHNTELPLSESAIIQYGDNHYLTTNPSPDEINASIWAIENHCNIKLDAPDSTALYNLLNAYFTATRYTNPLRLLLLTSPGTLDPALAAVRNLIHVGKYGNCDVTELAKINPFGCNPVPVQIGSNIIVNPSLVKKSGVLCSLEPDFNSCYNGWQTVFDFPSTRSNELLLVAANCEDQSDGAKNNFTQPLHPGTIYRLRFKYRAATTYNGANYPGFNTLIVQLGNVGSTPQAPVYIASGPEAGCVAPYIQSPGSFTLDDATTPANVALTNGAFLFKKQLSSSDLNYQQFEVYFRSGAPFATSLNMMAYTSNSSSSAALLRDFELVPVERKCFPYPGDPDFEYSIDWNVVASQCIFRANEERADLIAHAQDLLLENQITEYNRAYNCFDNVTEMLQYGYTPKEYHYTLYYYDQAGNLVQTAPPAGVVPNNDGPPLLSKLTTYQYNSYNQLTSQTTPDAGTSKFWYNNKAQLRLSQNAKQANPENKKFSYLKYDPIGRTTESGELTSATLWQSLQDIPAAIEERDFPLQSLETLSDITWTTYDINAGVAEFTQLNTRNRVSYTETTDTNNLPGNLDNIRTYFNYDAHGNVTDVLQHLADGFDKKIKYSYDLVSNKVNYVFFQFKAADEFAHKYSYDADNRIQTVSTSTDRFSWHQDAFV
ncbi:MAG: hypothetical protein WDO15_29370 [Bacteroidota bacterium]